MEIEVQIKTILNKIRPYLISDGGNLEFIKYEDNIVYVRLLGACANCNMLDITLKDGIEAAIQEEVPEVEEVVNLLSFDMDEL